MISSVSVDDFIYLWRFQFDSHLPPLAIPIFLLNYLHGRLKMLTELQLHFGWPLQGCQVHIHFTHQHVSLVTVKIAHEEREAA